MSDHKTGQKKKKLKLHKSSSLKKEENCVNIGYGERLSLNHRGQLCFFLEAFGIGFDRCFPDFYLWGSGRIEVSEADLAADFMQVHGRMSVVEIFQGSSKN